MLRALLVIGGLASVAVAAWLGMPNVDLESDPELARLLRGMAMIKAGMVVATTGVLLWRFAWPVSRPMACAYLVGSWLLAGATMLIWQLTLIPLAAALFHAGEVGLLVAAWRDSRGFARRNAASSGSGESSAAKPVRVATTQSHRKCEISLTM